MRPAIAEELRHRPGHDRWSIAVLAWGLAMEASAALDRLRDISSQVRNAVIFERGGDVIGSTIEDGERGKRLVQEAEALLAEAEQHRNESGGSGEFVQLEIALQGGSVFLVRDGNRLIAATTPPEPTVGLVFYDLKSCLRELEAPPPPPKKRTAPKRKPGPRTKKSDAKS
jgi:predicted regulator of Ras-like GTPase activity (Roadblock/LC7/MglB family)